VEHFGEASRAAGVRGLQAQPVGYTSAEAHGCVNQAFELSGLGGAHLRQIPVDAKGGMEVSALAAAIAEDKRNGLAPFMLIGTAGTVNTGAIDGLERLADIAGASKLWFHVDAAYGALAALSPKLKPLLKGLERAQSIAFDFHKWAHVPYDAGFLLVRDGQAHKRAFASPVAYLSRAPGGLAAGETWPCDLGPDLSRGFRALKAWFTFETLGADRIAAAIEGCCRVAKYLEARLKASERFEVAAPVALNIVCWRVKGARDDGIHEKIMMELHEKGIAAPSLTRLDGRPALRAAIVNHRTREVHIDRLIEAMSEIAARFGAS
ncbi:MAG: cytochrome D ubiquinol oxidase subunit I, partial [Hyphomicrobiaceae bacterium]